MSQKLTRVHIEELTLSRNHVLITPNFEEVYKNVKSTLMFQCLTCQSTFECTVHSYKNAKKTGCPECKKLKTSQTHQGKQVSKETRALIGEKARQRPGSLKDKFGGARKIIHVLKEVMDVIKKHAVLWILTG